MSGPATVRWPQYISTIVRDSPGMKWFGRSAWSAERKASASFLEPRGSHYVPAIHPALIVFSAGETPLDALQTG